MIDPFEEGVQAYEQGLSRDDNPYSINNETENWELWLDGFNYASFGD